MQAQRLANIGWPPGCRRGAGGAVRAASGGSGSASTLAPGAPPARQQAQQQLEPWAQAPRAAYVHLPFCKRKCFYCDFPVEAVGLNTAKPRTQDRIAAYVDLVCSEIAATAPLAGQQPLTTVSFGGGTPSLVPPAQLARILESLQARYGIAAGAEVSLEADPGTFDLPRLLEYKALGVSRLSMGVQAFQEDLLRACGRSHSLADVAAAIQAVHAAGFASWSLDLISGLPGLSLEVWRDSLAQAIAAAPDHVSIYDLQVETGTPFERWYGGADSPLPREGEAVAMYEAASALLRGAGYEHYEVSNYARPGHRSAHNSVYWRCAPYYAFGLGAASYVAGRRFTRPRTTAGYEAWLRGFVAARGGCPGAELPPEGKEERLLDAIMLSLRTSDGLDLLQLRSEHGQAVLDALLPAIERHFDSGLMALAGSQQQPPPMQDAAQTQRAGGSAFAQLQRWLQGAAAVPQQPGGSGCAVCLTDPAGFLLSNQVIADLFAEL